MVHPSLKFPNSTKRMNLLDTWAFKYRATVTLNNAHLQINWINSIISTAVWIFCVCVCEILTIYFNLNLTMCTSDHQNKFIFCTSPLTKEATAQLRRSGTGSFCHSRGGGYPEPERWHRIFHKSGRDLQRQRQVCLIWVGFFKIKMLHDIQSTGG